MAELLLSKIGLSIVKIWAYSLESILQPFQLLTYSMISLPYLLCNVISTPLFLKSFLAVFLFLEMLRLKGS